TLWNASNSSLLYELEGHSAAVVDTKWSPDGTVLLTASRDSTIVIWDAITRLPLQALTAHTHDVVSAVWSSEGARLISASRDGAVLLWDTASSATDTGPSMQVAQAFPRSMLFTDAITDGDISTEMIELNSETEFIDLTEWSLEDERGNTYIFPEVKLWEAGNRVRIYTRSATSDKDQLPGVQALQ